MFFVNSSLCLRLPFVQRWAPSGSLWVSLGSLWASFKVPRTMHLIVGVGIWGMKGEARGNKGELGYLLSVGDGRLR